MSNQTSSTPLTFEQVYTKPAFRNQLTLAAQLYREVQKSKTLIAAQAWVGSFEALLCNQVRRRKQLQKREFLTIWAFLFLLTVGPMYHGNAPIDLASTAHTAANLYIEVSLLTRVVAYAIDFANAREKLGKLPSWLVLHHVGVFAVHITVALYFSRTYYKTMLYLLGIQSTHNTWTKKYSMVLYWGNVLLGVITSICVSAMNIMQDEVSLSLAPRVCISVALVTTCVGVSLLVVDCHGKKTQHR